MAMAQVAAALKRMRGASEVISAGHPLLRRDSLPVDPQKIQTKEVQARMVKVMRQEQGVGLAAPQIGVNLQVAVMEVTEQAIKDVAQHSNVSKLGMRLLPLKVMINPTVKAVGTARATHREGCLSVKHYTAHVERFREVEVQSYNEKGELEKWKAKDWTARVVQHECDHLRGGLFVDVMDSKSFGYDDELAKHPPSPQDWKNDGAR